MPAPAPVPVPVPVPVPMPVPMTVLVPVPVPVPVLRLQVFLFACTCVWSCASCAITCRCVDFVGACARPLMHPRVPVLVVVLMFAVLVVLLTWEKFNCIWGGGGAFEPTFRTPPPQSLKSATVTEALGRQGPSRGSQQYEHDSHDALMPEVSTLPAPKGAPENFPKFCKNFHPDFKLVF